MLILANAHKTKLIMAAHDGDMKKALQEIVELMKDK